MPGAVAHAPRSSTVSGREHCEDCALAISPETHRAYPISAHEDAYQASMLSLAVQEHSESGSAP